MQYPAVITKEGKHILAEFPDCPGCQTFASPQEDIEQMASEALQGWLESHLANGEVPPLPSSRAPRGKVLWVVVPAVLAAKVNLRVMRNMRGWTQAELAKAMGVSQPMVAKMENPDESIGFDTYQKAAHALGLVFDPAMKEPRRVAS